MRTASTFNVGMFAADAGRVAGSSILPLTSTWWATYGASIESGPFSRN